MTGYADTPRLEDGKDQPCRDVLAKPFPLDAILATVRLLLDERAASSPRETARGLE